MKYNPKGLILIFGISNVVSIYAGSEYFFAHIDLEPLLNTLGNVAKTSEKYLQLEEKRLDKIRRFTKEYDKLHKYATINADNFLTNPINAYLLVKRLTTDWKFVVNLVEESAGKDLVQNITKEYIFPTNDDSGEASYMVIRLQDTYLLNTTELARGDVAGMKGTTELTASDCFELSASAYSIRDFKRTVLWSYETLSRLSKDEFGMVDTKVLLDNLSFLGRKLENVQQAFQLTKIVIQKYIYPPQVPENMNSSANIRKKDFETTDSKAKEKYTQDNSNISKKETPKEDLISMLIEIEKLKKLCRGEQLRSPVQESKLKCRYTSCGSKYLLLQPVKEETLNLNPRVVVYHDVIRDNDIQILKNISEHMLKKATIYNPKTGEPEVAKARVSKSGWLPDVAHLRVKHMSNMIEEITGLETRTAEDLQIQKYGLGGHYGLHYDFRRTEEMDWFAKLNTGNRIATWLIYLGDVEAGGSTVFPEIDVQVKPIKGSACFWHNLYKSGRGDLRTKHAACPVLVGRKWVANKWFHERGQEFRRPCGLNPLE